jgi:hypothetical protein
MAAKGTVWTADFKERREPIEGRYGWILAVKDLASRYQLAWLPLEEATADVVQATYVRLFAEHGPFQADSTKHLLAAAAVTALFNPRRARATTAGSSGPIDN